MELGEHERWARLDKRIERARARHELTRLVMGTIFLVLIGGIIYILIPWLNVVPAENV